MIRTLTTSNRGGQTMLDPLLALLSLNFLTLPDNSSRKVVSASASTSGLAATIQLGQGVTTEPMNRTSPESLYGLVVNLA